MRKQLALRDSTTKFPSKVARKFASNNRKHYPDLRSDESSVEFQASMSSWGNVGCFLKLNEWMILK